MVAFYVPIGLQRVALPSLTYAGFASTASTGTSVTLTGVPFSTAGNRTVVIGVRYSTSGSMSSATIGGVSATLVSGSHVTGDLIILAAYVPTGTSGSVVLNASASLSTIGMQVYALYDLLSSTATASSTDTVDTLNFSLNVSANGICVAFGNLNAASLPADPTWSGVTVDHSDAIGSFDKLSCGSKVATSAISPLAVQMSKGGGFPTEWGAAASFR